MKNSLKTFPESERTPIDLPYQKWKEAFEKEFRAKLENSKAEMKRYRHEKMKGAVQWEAIRQEIIKEVLGE